MSSFCHVKLVGSHIDQSLRKVCFIAKLALSFYNSQLQRQLVHSQVITTCLNMQGEQRITKEYAKDAKFEDCVKKQSL